MKVKLKKDVKVSDIPRNSGTHKRAIWAFTNNEKELEIDVLPKDLSNYVELIKNKETKLKGDK
ncbi:MAG: hypothetical protein Unbinned3325contig1000_37 [Prokaryotic dsDNA virus sp.]|nr:MAG: hypothetical protein Unbinned3325contig1000_37 [Prokaryotic dsDNA virus sp.]|tara:strand:+ start:1082 stop:1270 length:189 start_codon:yes stop_codon:yes gene_type:complete